MNDCLLKKNADMIDKQLNEAKNQTIVHGDAKLANFCFSNDGSVAAVDFQYVGGGCGMKDVAYFLSSCLSSDECFMHESELLDHYFEQLKQTVEPSSFEALEIEWRTLYAFAWADFVRFLSGWNPEHYKVHEYSLSKVSEVL